MPQPLASWNPERDVWETMLVDLFSGLSDVFSETWPPSGMTRNGCAFELPTSERVTCEPGSLLLHTPRATRGGSTSENMKMLVTPTAQIAINGGSQSPEKRRAGGHGPTLADQIEHMS